MQSKARICSLFVEVDGGETTRRFDDSVERAGLTSDWPDTGILTVLIRPANLAAMRMYRGGVAQTACYRYRRRQTHRERYKYNNAFSKDGPSCLAYADSREATVSMPKGTTRIRLGRQVDDPGRVALSAALVLLELWTLEVKTESAVHILHSRQHRLSAHFVCMYEVCTHPRHEAGRHASYRDRP